MRAAVELPAFLKTQNEANSPSYELRAALAERLASWQPVLRETARATTRLRACVEAEHPVLCVVAE
ncbi:hypothetical protein MHZ93_07150 [Roseomonas sp. ACRSG]|nr:hypothetical protein [Roseomonas sp. ACRSG]